MKNKYQLCLADHELIPFDLDDPQILQNYGKRSNELLLKHNITKREWFDWLMARAKDNEY